MIRAKYDTQSKRHEYLLKVKIEKRKMKSEFAKNSIFICPRNSCCCKNQLFCFDIICSYF